MHISASERNEGNDRIIDALQHTMTENGVKPLITASDGATLGDAINADNNFTVMLHNKALFDEFNKDTCIILFTDAPAMDLLDKIIRHSGPQNILLVGVRNYPENVSSLIARHHIKSYTMREISFEGLHETCDAVMAASRTFKNLCVCIDLRVLDPAFAPGIISEPGGLTTRELIYFMQRLRLLKNLRLGILFNDMHDSSPELVILAAKILAELAPG